MRGRAFLEVARELVRNGSEAHRRAAAGRAYYALMLEVRDLLERWGFPAPPRDKVHHFVRFKLIYSTDSDLKQVGRRLEDLSRLRNQADYDLSGSSHLFTQDRWVENAIEDAGEAIALLDEIDGDDARREAARASLGPL